MPTTAESCIRLYEDMKMRRGTYDSHCQVVSEYCWSSNDEFFQDGVGGFSTQGEMRKQRVYDDTAGLALLRFASLAESLLAPSDQIWHNLVPSGANLMNTKRVEDYFYELNKTLFRYRYDPKSGFQAQMHESFMSLGAYGRNGIYIDADPDGGLRYRANWVGDTFIEVNHQGIVDTVVRRFYYSAVQAEQRFGRENLPEHVLKKLEDDPLHREEYLHIIKPDSENETDGKRFLSLYVHYNSREVLERGGYNTFPNPVGRYTTSPHEVEGRGPAMFALPDILTLNEMAKNDLRASNMAVAPPLLLADDGYLTGGASNVNANPNGIIYGGIGADGSRRVDFLQSNARLDLLEMKMESMRRDIREAFLNDFFNLIDETKRMATTEVLLREQKQGALIGPLIGRQTTELLSPMIMRELDVLDSQGLLPEPPPEIEDAQFEFDIKFDSPLTRARNKEELIGIQRLIEFGTQVAPFDNGDTIRTFDTIEMAKFIRRGEGAPPTVVKSDDRIASERQTEAQAAQAQQVIEGAPKVAQARERLAKAEQIQRGG